MIGLLPILARWRFGLSIAAALAFLGLALAANHYRHAYHAEKALRKADRAAYSQAQAEAALIAREALARQEHIYVTKAQEIEHEYVSKIADARSVADRYIASHRVRWEAPSSATGPAIASAESGSAHSADRSSAAPDLVAVSAADVLICTDNTKRLEAAREWALSLND